MRNENTSTAARTTNTSTTTTTNKATTKLSSSSSSSAAAAKSSSRNEKSSPLASSTTLNAYSDDPLDIEGYTRSRARSALTYLGIVLTLGLLRLYFFWKPHLMLKATHRKCPLKHASKILVVDKYRQRFIETCMCVEGVSFGGLLATIYPPAEITNTKSNEAGAVIDETNPLIEGLIVYIRFKM